MALEHALLVSLRERPSSGLELAQRFDKSIGFFWSATHQQIYRVLRRMQNDGWVESDTNSDSGRERIIYSVTQTGQQVLSDWLAQPGDPDQFRSSLAVRMRGASYTTDAGRVALRADLQRHRADHQARLAHYQSLAARDYPDPDQLTGRELDHYLVLRGGIAHEQFWIDWLTEYLETR
ncbi:MAG TPA: PadR family transcriptional regulator [Marmoricola sp.]|nr:PadR family transcriptional regulator [Marmoricola sp.]